uniref:Uncharacterized protein n=1 Tax=Cacopsylla melanoneura TaxID=428564 RepID=A0A8D9DT37_9HEMI
MSNMSMSGKDAKKPGIPGSARCSRIKSSGSLTRSNSLLSLDRSRVAAPSAVNKTMVKRSHSVSVKKDTLPKTSEIVVNTMDPESELLFHEKFLELYEMSSKYSVLEDQHIAMSQVMFLQNKASEKQQELLDLSKKIVNLKQAVEMKQECDQLIPEYTNVISKLESASQILTELGSVSSFICNRVQVDNFESLTPDMLNEIQANVDGMKEDLEHLKQVRVLYRESETMIEETVKKLECLGEKIERLQSIKADIDMLEPLQRSRDIQASCLLKRG